MAAETIRVDGLKELNIALRKVDRDAPRELASELSGISTHVMNRARPKVPRISGDAAASIKVRKKAKGSMLAIGGARAPYMPWLNFGGSVGRSKSIHRPMVKPDYFIYRTLSEEKSTIDRMLNSALERMGRRAGFEVT